MFPLSDSEKGRLQRLNKDQNAVFALKKLFINTALKGVIPPDTQTLAAERIALDIIQEVFRQLNNIQPTNQRAEVKTNLI